MATNDNQNEKSVAEKAEDVVKTVKKNVEKTVTTAKKNVEKTVEKTVATAKKTAAKATAKTKPAPKKQRAKVLVSIVNKGDEHSLKEILDDVSVSLSFVFSGSGTARSAVLDYLGIGQTEKSVLISLIPEYDEETIMREIRAKLALYLVGRGISFTIPLSAVSEIIANGITGASTNKTMEGKKIMSDEERQFSLIVAAVAANHTDEAMEAARSAGAAGGTIIRARSIDNKKAEQFVGITLTTEQELLLILAKKESKMAIMQAISETAGLKTEAGGVIFSMPVDKTAGIGVQEAPADEKK